MRRPAMIRIFCWIYCLLVLAAWLIMVRSGDVWWPATVLLFSPRWLLALPAFPIVIYSVMRDRWLLPPLAVVLIVVFVPLMGLKYSTTAGSIPFKGKPLRVMTCNIHTGEFDQLKLALLIRQTAADIVTLQECPPALVLSAPPGWYIAQSRGFAVLSRFPLNGLNFVTIAPPGEQWQRPLLLQTVAKTPGGDIAICTLQLPTPRFGLQEMFDRKTILRPARRGLLLKETAFRRQSAEKVRSYAASLGIPVILAGDFNTPTDSRMFQEVWTGWSNAFSETGRGYGWTQRVSVSGLKYSARIDHVLTSKQLRPLTSGIGPDIDSDHLPLIADIAWNNGP